MVIAWHNLLWQPDQASGAELNWVTSAPWASVALMITLAVVVLTVSNMALQRHRPGRRSYKRGRALDFNLEVARMENLPVSKAAEAPQGPVHLEGRLVASEGSLGGPPERACVWHNRAGSGRSTAIASERLLFEDESGCVVVTELEDARVIAPKETDRGPHDTVSLYLGDRVELLGHYRPFPSPKSEPKTSEDEQSKTAYGSLGQDSQIQIRVLSRDTPAPSE